MLWTGYWGKMMTAYDGENEVSIYLKKLPGNVRAFSLCLADSRIVVLNDCLSPTGMHEAYQHELLHFLRKDHDNESYREY